MVADEQTAGQGRHGQPGIPSRERALLLDRAASPTPLLTLALGLATAEAIAQATASLRSPLAQRRDARRQEGRRHPGATGRRHAIAGIGINVNQTRVSARAWKLPPRCALHTGRERLARGPARSPCSPPSRLSLAEDTDDDPAPVHRASSYAAGRRVVVRSARTASSTAPPPASTPTAILIVRKDDGTDTLILAGGVRAAGA